MTQTQRNLPAELRRRASAIAATASLLLGAASSPANAVDWNGAGGNNNWSTAGNWVGGVAPPSHPFAFITFGAAGTTFTPVTDAPWDLNRLDIGGATPYVLSGSLLTFGATGSAINVGGSPHAIGNDLALGGTGPLTFTAASDVTYSGAMSGTSGLIKAGAGRLTLTNAAALTAAGGSIAINGGTLRLGDGTNGPTLLPSNLVNNATIDFAAPPLGLIAPSGLTGTGNVVVSSGRVDVFGAAFMHSGSTTLTGTSILAGTVTNNGALVIAAGAQMDAINTTVGSLAGAGLLNVLTGGITVGGDGTTTTFSGTIGAGGAFRKTGPGRLILTNPDANAAFGFGTFTVGGGVLQVGDGVTGPPFLPANIVNNATIDFAASPFGFATPSGLSGTGNVVVSSGRVDAFGPPLTHAGSTTVTGSSILAATVINNSPLVIEAGSHMDALNGTTVGSLAGSGELFVVTGALTLGGDNSDTTFSGNLMLGTFAKVGSGAFTFSGTGSGGSALVKSGTLVLSGSLGAVTVNAGATIEGSGTANGALLVDDGATLRVPIEGTLPGAGYGRLTATSSVTVTEATLSVSGAYVPSVGDVFTIVDKPSPGAVSGTFAGLPEGATFVFNGATLRVSYVGGTGNDITLTVISTTAVVWNGAGANDNWSTNASWVAGAAPPSTPTTFVAFPAGAARPGPVVDAPWTINRMDVAGPSPYAFGGQAITFAGTAPRLNSSGAAHVITNPLAMATALTISNASSLALTGAIGGGAGLTKSGAGVLTLSGSNTYPGATSVGAGTLLVDGTIAGPMAVASGATLGGSGSIGGAVTVGAGGTLAPGTSAGQISTGNLTLNGTLLIDILGPAPGTQHDATNVAGTVTIAGGALALAGTYVPVPGDTFTIVTNDAAEAITGTFTGLPEGATLAFNGGTLRISYVGGSGNDIVLTAFALASTAWNGAGANPDWSTGANWVGGVAPASNASAFVTFGPAATAFGARAETARTLNRIDISGATPYTILGLPITFAGAAPQLNVSGSVHNIFNDLVNGSATPLAISTASDLTYAGQISGAGLIKQGAAHLVLTHPNAFASFGGGVAVDAGTLQLGDGMTGPALLPPNVVDNATIDFAAPPLGLIAPSGLTGTGNVVVSSGRVDVFGTAFTHAGSTTLTGTSILAGTVTNNGALVIAAGARMDAINCTVGSLAGAGLLNVLTGGITVGGDGTTTTFSGTIGAGGAFLKTGTGRLILTNPDANAAFGSGTFTVGDGVVQVGDGVTGPAFLPPNVIDNATLDFAAPPAGIAVPAGLAGTGNVVVSSGRVDVFGTPLAHAGSTTLTGSSILAGIVTNNGALDIGANARMDAINSTVGSLTGAGLLNVLASGITVGGDGTDTTFSGTLGAGGAFVKVGAGRLTLTNPDANAAFGFGSFTVDGGVLQVGDGASGPAFLPPNVVDNATIDFAGGVASVVVPAGLTGTGNVVVSSGQVNVIGTALTHGGSTTVAGTSVLIGGVNNNGPLVIDAGARMDAVDSTVGSIAGAGELNLLGGGLIAGGDGTSTTFSGPIGAFAAFTKTGTGTLLLTGNGTHSGVKTVAGGTLLLTGAIAGSIVVEAGATFGGTGATGPVTVNAGGTLAPGLSPGVISTGDLVIGGAMLVEIEGTTLGTQYDNTNVTGTVTIAAGTLTLAGAYVPLAGDVFTIVTNDGADAVAGAFAGLPEGAALVFNGSTLRISYVGGTGNDITLTAISTTTVVWNGAGANDNWSTGANWVTGFAPLSGATTFVTFPAASGRFAPVADTPFTLNRMDVTGASAYSISGQAISFTGATPRITTSGAAHAIANPLTLSAAFTVSNASALTLSGAIGGASSLTKTGAGVLTLSGPGTYAGGTTVSAGTLIVTASIAGPVAVAGATLGGTGTIGGPVTVLAGATLSPGLSPGIINTGDLTLAGVALIEIAGATLGTQYDNVNVTGTVTIAGATLTLVGAYAPVAGDTFTIITNDGADPVAGTFAGLPEGATITLNGRTLAISYVGGTGNDVVLALAAPAGGVAIPTLSQWFLLVLAALVAGFGILGGSIRGPRSRVLES